MCAPVQNSKQEIHQDAAAVCGSLQKSWWDNLKHELYHHFPYATMSVASALIVLSLINVFFYSGISECVDAGVVGAVCEHGHHHGSGMDILFHSFHFIHVLFAVSGTMTMFFRFAPKRIGMGIVLGIFSAVVFCTLSDVLLPYAAGMLLGVPMELHICFHSELHNIIPFLLVGMVNGLVMSKVADFVSEQSVLTLHFWHTFISAMASICYAVGHGLSDFYHHLGIFFLLMVLAVVIPCTLADVVAPLVFAKFVAEE